MDYSIQSLPLSFFVLKFTSNSEIKSGQSRFSSGSQVLSELKCKKSKISEFLMNLNRTYTYKIRYLLSISSVFLIKF